MRRTCLAFLTGRRLRCPRSGDKTKTSETILDQIRPGLSGTSFLARRSAGLYDSSA
ncbi:MAG: hypothetical protein OXU61_04235 [Gammaproteobacteria bacterium]|nr:hypothetical protein [Gammaproteobacteria bacterium]